LHDDNMMSNDSMNMNGNNMSMKKTRGYTNIDCSINIFDEI